MRSKTKIVYAIITSPADTTIEFDKLLENIAGIAGSSLYRITYQTIAAIVSNIEDLKSLSLQHTALEYANVIEKLSQHLSLLPAKFGSVLTSGNDVLQFLERHYIHFSNNLTAVDRKYEYGLKVFCHSEATVRNHPTNAVVKRNTSEYIASSTIQATYLLQKIKRQQEADARGEFVEDLNRTINRYLVPLQVIQKINTVATRTLLLDTVFLVDKNRQAEFIEIVMQFKDRYPDLYFLLTGPWAPYNFVESLVLKTMGTL
jgi:hypothetical protein